MRKEKKDADRQVLQANRSGVFQVECQGTNFGVLDNRAIADPEQIFLGGNEGSRRGQGVRQ